MDVTTALVAFIFVCIIFPNLIKDKNQFYAAFAIILLGILLHSLAEMINSDGFRRFAGAFNGLLHVAAMVLLVLAAGGLRPRELMGEMSRAFEVMRRGETEKEVIIPLTGQQPKPREKEETPRRYAIDEPPPPSRPKDEGSVPLE